MSSPSWSHARAPSLALGLVLAATAGCGGSQSSSATSEPTLSPETAIAAEPPAPATVEPTPAPPPPDPEADKKRAAAEAAAKALAEIETEAAAEKARWTDELKAEAAALADASGKQSAKTALKKILASKIRRPGHAERDAHRHPVETLTFFGIKPTSTVVELGAGEGWYTEVLAPLLAARGKLIVIGRGDPAGPVDDMSTVYARRLASMLATRPELFAKVETRSITPPGSMTLAEPGTVDLVVAIREMHNWQRRGQLDAYLAAIHAALKDGGTFGVVAHRATPGAAVEQTAEKGYLPEAWLIERVTAAGFKLAGKSAVNANPKDTHDHPEGVWTLPPSFALGDQDRARYAAIGESDRMTLRFKKAKVKKAPPAAPAAPATPAAPPAPAAPTTP